MGRALEEAQAQGVNIALENTRFLRYNQYLYQRLNSPRLKFCFDSGHANCYTPQEDPLALFGDKLCTMHLHDNYGPGQGTSTTRWGRNGGFRRAVQALGSDEPGEL